MFSFILGFMTVAVLGGIGCLIMFIRYKSLREKRDWEQK